MPDPNIIAFEDKKLAYIGICKAANTSVKRAFMNALGQYRDYVHKRSSFNYVNHKYLLGKAGWLIFTIIRHPKARFESCFREKVWRPEGLHPGFKRKGLEEITWKMPFDAFVKAVARIPDAKSEQHFRGQAQDLVCDGKLLANAWCQVESLVKDWAEMSEKIYRHCGFKLQSDLPRDNDGESIEAPVKWTPELEQIHYNRFVRDYELLGYNLKERFE